MNALQRGLLALVFLGFGSMAMASEVDEGMGRLFDSAEAMQSWAGPGEPFPGMILNLRSEVMVQRGDAMTYRLPFPGRGDLRFERVSSANRSRAGFTWHGRIAERGGVTGDLVLSARDGVVVGSFYSNLGQFQIRPRTDGTHRLDEIIEKGSCGVDSHRHRVSGFPAGSVEDSAAVSSTVYRADGIVTLDVMMLYSADAYDGSLGFIEADITNAIDAANVAMANSNSSARFNLVHAQQISFNESGDLDTDLDAILASPGVAALRDQHAADLVGIVVEAPWSSYCGLAEVMQEPDPGFDQWAFSITARDCLLNLTPAHEFGHNLGLEHNPENADTAPEEASYPWSFGHWRDDLFNGFHTVMSYSNPCVFCPGIAHFSNPEVDWDGNPTGTATRDNHRTLDEGDAGIGTAQIARAFRFNSNEDDRYEDNDSITQAWDLSASENTRLSQLRSEGVHRDDDWYEIWVSAGSERVQVLLEFTHAEGDIDVMLLDAGGNELARSQSVTDNELIDTIVPGQGIYYIRVYYQPEGNTYDMLWSALPTAPDLAVTTDLEDRITIPFETFIFRATLQNQGSASSSASTLRFFRSTDSLVSPTDVQVDTEPVPAMSFGESLAIQSGVLVTPPNVGTYYYYACVDAVAGEADPSVQSNCTSSVRFDVVDIDQQPDLVVPETFVIGDGPGGAVFTGLQMNVSAYPKNIGGEPAAGSTVRYYLSLNPVVSPQDTQLGFLPVQALGSGQEQFRLISVPAPDVATSYWIAACVDVVENEFSSANQCSTPTRVEVRASDAIFSSRFD